MGRNPNSIGSILSRTIKQGDCLIWQGALSRDGRYGSVSYFDKTIRVHRLVYMLNNNLDELSAHVLHRCDTPLCVNPDHLFLGYDQDNMTDKVAKGRQAKGVDCNHPHRKLDDDAVREIRRLRQSGVQILELARQFNCSKGSIINVLKYRTWKHVT